MCTKVYCITPLAWVEIQCFALTVDMPTCLHVDLRAGLHAYVLTGLLADRSEEDAWLGWLDWAGWAGWAGWLAGWLGQRAAGQVGWAVLAGLGGRGQQRAISEGSKVAREEQQDG